MVRAIGIGSGDIAWTLNDRIPLFIRAGGAGRAGGDLVGVRGRPAGQTDFAPTLLALLGIDSVPLPYLGRNLLGATVDRPVSRPYGEWLDARHLFLSGDPVARCYDLGRRLVGAPSGCAAEDAMARRVRDLSRLVVTDDLQELLRARLTTNPNP